MIQFRQVEPDVGGPVWSISEFRGCEKTGPFRLSFVKANFGCVNAWTINSATYSAVAGNLADRPRVADAPVTWWSHFRMWGTTGWISTC